MATASVKWLPLRPGVFTSEDRTAIVTLHPARDGRPERWTLSFVDIDGARVRKSFASRSDARKFLNTAD